MKTKFFCLLLASCLALCLMLCACQDPQNSDTGGDKNTPIYTLGTDIGNKLPPREVEIFDENGKSGEYIDPTSLGKVTVINFWGTWCSYCLIELPYFDEIATEMKNEVSFVAIHSVYRFASDAVNYVNANYKDSDIVFAKDTGSTDRLDDCYSLYGGYGSYPYTIIIDENGIITYKTVGTISESTLRLKLEEALAK